MADAETWPDIAHMTPREMAEEIASLRHALNELRDDASTSEEA